MCLKGFLFNRSKIKKSIKINFKKLTNKDIFRTDKGCLNKVDTESRQLKCDHRYDLNCDLPNCDLHSPQQYNAYKNFCELFFTKPLDIRDFFYKDSLHNDDPNNNESDHKQTNCSTCSELPNKLCDQQSPTVDEVLKIAF